MQTKSQEKIDSGNVRLIFAKNISCLRHLRNLTQKQMADALGISIHRYGAWEEGRAMPKLSMFIKLCDYLGDKDIYNLLTTPIE